MLRSLCTTAFWLTALLVSALQGPAQAQSFLRGDVDGDLAVDVDDLSQLLNLLASGLPPSSYPAAADANDNGAVELSDGVALGRYLQFGVPFLPPPFPFAGLDPTPNLFAPAPAVGIEFRVPPSVLFIGDPVAWVPVHLDNVTPLAGIEVALAFDSEKLVVSGWDFSDSVLDASGAGFEYVATGLSNEPGRAGVWLSAAVDVAPPLLGGVLPVGSDQRIGQLEVRAHDSVHRSTVTHLVFRDLASESPRRNLVVDSFGTARRPQTSSGVIELRVAFVRGDVNRDGAVDISDVVFLLAYTFANGPPPQCLDASDVNDDGAIDLVDAVYGLAFLFSNGPAPTAPYPIRGSDPTTDSVACRGDVPTIDVWYGSRQRVGLHGTVQSQANILGRVQGLSPNTPVTYSLNGGPEQVLTIGPNTRRLADVGDFVIELPLTDLVPGANSVTIYAGVAEETVILDYEPNTVWPRPFVVDGSSAVTIDEVAQVVDGLWEFSGDGFAVVDPGYDRLIGLGDVSWTDFQVTARVSVSAFEPVYTGPSAPGPLVGFLLRWQGHQPTGTQPNWGFLPFGALGCYQRRVGGVERFEMRDDGGVVATDSSGLTFPLESDFYLKMRVETTPGQGGRYQFKAWPAESSEPPFWLLDSTRPPGDLAAGSLLLVAHHVVATFSEIVIE